jgi:aryl-alcohol dehydrogenase-like predicted oxidoreductase
VSTVITGASRVEQVHENMKSAEVAAKITPEVMEKIDAIFGVKKKDEDDD